jgi:hypothetical protein
MKDKPTFTVARGRGSKGVEGRVKPGHDVVRAAGEKIKGSFLRSKLGALPCFS